MEWKAVEVTAQSIIDDAEGTVLARWGSRSSGSHLQWQESLPWNLEGHRPLLIVPFYNPDLVKGVAVNFDPRHDAIIGSRTTGRKGNSITDLVGCTASK